jgi:hypothetical protein
MGLTVLPFAYDAAVGFYILKTLFSKNIEQREADLIEEVNKTATEKEFNDRLPNVLKNGEVAQKMFTKGWKFDMFNVDGQLNKQLAAIAIIFGTLYFSLVSVAYKDHMCFSLIVIAYSLICLFSFFNVSYVRDFDVLQVNIVPVILSVVGLITLNHSYSASMLAMTGALSLDSYFAIRYKSESDKIKYNPIELFAMESWTQ